MLSQPGRMLAAPTRHGSSTIYALAGPAPGNPDPAAQSRNGVHDVSSAADDTATFGSLLRGYRGMAGFSQDELAELAGVSRRGISDLERGVRRSPYFSTVRRLAEALGLNASERARLLIAARRC